MKLLSCALIACVIWLLPVHAHLLIRFDQEIRYHISVQVIGLSWLHVQKKTDARPEKLRSIHFLSEKNTPDSVLFSVLMGQGHLMKLFKLCRWHHLELTAKISFKDAALTAMAYTLLNIVLQVCRCCGLLRSENKIQLSFRGEGTSVTLSCIASARLGSIGIAAVRLWIAAAVEKARRRKAKEEEYAASH